MNRTEKQGLVSNLKERLDSKNFVLAGFNGLTVVEMEELRSNLRGVNCSANVVKNRLLSIALKELNLEGYDEFLKDTTLLAIQNEEGSFEALKLLKKFAEDNDKFFIKSGQIEGNAVTSDEISTIAGLPSKEVLVAQLLSRLNAPISKLVYALNGPISNLVFVLEAIKNNKE
jgi:large subunit ribosomal protein L10